MVDPQGPCYGRFSEIFRSAVAEALRTGNPLPDGFVDRLGTALNCQPGLVLVGRGRTAVAGGS